jgi:hypothetical protein
LSTSVRPFTVKLLVALDVVLGVLGLLPLLFPQLRPFPRFVIVNDLGSIVFTLICFILAYGLWSKRGWAWVSSLVFSILGIAIFIFTLFVRPRTGEFVSLVMDLVILYLLMQPGVQRYSGKLSGLHQASV